MKCPADAASTRESLDFEKLRSLIQSSGVRRIEDLLPMLPTPYRSHFVVMYGSRAFAEASFKEPKVISYGDFGKFLLTFTGSQTSAHSQSLEMIEYKDCQRAFELHVIHFAPNHAPQISEKNPGVCLKCHGADPRPLWDNYPAWRGAFGSFSGSNGLEAIRPDSEEGQALAAFVTGKEYLRGRYAALDWTEFLRPPEQRKPGHAPNNELNMRVDKWNYHRIARVLIRSPQYPRFKYALAGLALGCFDDQPSDITDWIPPNARPTTSWQALRSDIEKTIRADSARRLKPVVAASGYKDLAASVGPFFDLADLDLKTTDRFLLDAMGVSFSELSPTFQDGTYAFGSTADSIQALNDTLLEEFSSLGDPDLTQINADSVEMIDFSPHYADRVRYVGSDLCPSLKAKSLEAISKGPDGAEE